ncbi:MAG: hypothetical protein KDD82_02925 [Planctomycetes bacterium]|nr:hypothetical protein [Planctomycetota bacterium]
MTRPAFVPVNATRAQPLEVELAPAQRCPYCRGGVDPEHALVACGRCHTVLHPDCAEHGCTTLGCAPVPRLRFAPKARRRPWPRLRWRRLALSAAVLVACGAGLSFAWAQRIVAPPAPPPVVWAPPPVVCLDSPNPVAFEAPDPLTSAPPTSPFGSAGPWVEVRGDVAFVRGETSRAGVLTVEGPGGQTLSWHQDRPGPFEATLSLTGILRTTSTALVTVRLKTSDGVEFTRDVVRWG